MHRIKLNQLEMLVAVADNGGFGAAAAALQCTQSRISHAITELEAAVGARLLTRSRSGCTPTASGQAVIDKARQMLRLAGAIEVIAGAAPGGHVRIACFRSVGSHLLPHALAALAADHPAIRVDIDDSCEERDAVTRAVHEGRADIGIAQLPVPQHLVAQQFASDHYVLALPAALALDLPVTWAQLKRLPYIQLDCAGALAILARCRAAGFDAVLSRTLATDTGIAAMIRQGMGYSILPRLAIYPEPAGVQIAALPIPAQREFALVATPEVARDQAVRVVMQYLRNRRYLKQSDAFKAGLIAC